MPSRLYFSIAATALPKNFVRPAAVAAISENPTDPLPPPPADTTTCNVGLSFFNPLSTARLAASFAPLATIMPSCSLKNA
jgi:hypothetical protein